MSPTLDAFLRSWPFEPWLLSSLVLTACDLPARLAGSIPAEPRALARRPALARFCGGLAVLYLALASPIEPFAALLLQVHMLQHLLLMMAAPPLLWLGDPMLPLLRGLPQPVRTYWVAPLLRWPHVAPLLFAADAPGGGLVLVCRDHLAVARAGGLRTRPAVRTVGIISSMSVSSPPGCYSGIRSSARIRARPRWSLWLLLPYLILADVQNTILSALLTFSDHVLYPYYLQIPRLGGSRPWKINQRLASSCGCPALWRFSCRCLQSASATVRSGATSADAGRPKGSKSAVQDGHLPRLHVCTVRHLPLADS